MYFTYVDLPRGEIHSDSFVVTMDMEGIDVERALVDIGSNINILYKDMLSKHGVDKTMMKPTRMPLFGFTGDKVEMEGTIELGVDLSTNPDVLKTKMEFVIVNISCFHNAILGNK